MRGVLAVEDWAEIRRLNRAEDLPVIRFPRMHFCAGCRRLDLLNKFCAWDENICHECQRSLTPSRFVACCPQGHIAEFPYFRWLHIGQSTDDPAGHGMSLTTRGQSSSLSDILIACSCGVKPRSMAGSFGGQALADVVRCPGERP